MTTHAQQRPQPTAAACTHSQSSSDSRSRISHASPARCCSPSPACWRPRRHSWRRPTSRSSRDASPMRPAARCPAPPSPPPASRPDSSQTSVTDDTGGYVFVSLTAGSYALRVELTGFKPVERTNFVLDAASRRAADFQLEVGSITETISIAAITSQVETQSGDVSRVITGEQVNNIALNGRNYAQLLQLLPGAVATNTNPFGIGLTTTGQAINGVRSPSTYFMVDGADNMDNGANGAAITQPSLDTISEIKVLTAGYSAEFGGRAGALINVVTKGGTREFQRQRLRVHPRREVRRARVLRSGRAGAARLQQRGLHHRRPDHARRLQRRPLEAVLLLRAGLEEEPSRRDAGHDGADRRGTQRRLPQFLARRAARSADGPTVRRSHDSLLALLGERPRAPLRVSRAELRRPRRQLRRDRHESDRQPRRGRAHRLRALVAHADQLSLYAQRRRHLQSVPGRQHRHRPRHPPASGMDHGRQHAADALEHAAELGRDFGDAESDPGGSGQLDPRPLARCA